MNYIGPVFVIFINYITFLVINVTYTIRLFAFVKISKSQVIVNYSSTKAKTLFVFPFNIIPCVATPRQSTHS